MYLRFLSLSKQIPTLVDWPNVWQGLWPSNCVQAASGGRDQAVEVKLLMIGSTQVGFKQHEGFFLVRTSLKHMSWYDIALHHWWERSAKKWQKIVLLQLGKASMAKLVQQKLASSSRGTSVTAWLPLGELKCATTCKMIKMGMVIVIMRCILTPHSSATGSQASTWKCHYWKTWSSINESEYVTYQRKTSMYCFFHSQ